MSAKSDRSKTTEFSAGVILGVTALLALVLILHHPVLQGGHGAAQLAASAQPLARMDRIVHGGLIAMFALQAFALYVFSVSLGLRRPAVVGGLLAFFAGVILMVIPAMLDGFVFPDVAAACLRAAGGCGDPEGGVFRLIAVMIQDFTKVALMAMSIGTLSWAIALLTSQGLVLKLSGVAGLACAAVPLFILVFSNVYLKPSNLAGVAAAQLVWSLLVAILLMTGAVRAAVGADLATDQAAVGSS